MTDFETDLIAQDLAHIWHPCSQMKDYEQFKPLVVTGAAGSYLELANGRRLIDAISSWWCKSLGHGHPRLKRALQSQIERFEHVILANTTNNVIVELSNRLAALTPHLNKVMYAGDGSCAVEIALKMSVHAQQLRGESQRQSFAALVNGFHGETALTMSVSDLSLYREPYESLLIDAHFIGPLPYVSGRDDPVWNDCSAHWEGIETQLEKIENGLAAIVLEPILQGSGGMLVYSQDVLRRLAAWCREHGVYLICDEIMTGLGRTGAALASEHAGIEPDFICLSKGLTSGWLPCSAVLTRDAIYDLFYDDYASGKAFMHSHTYSGNALAAAVACETLQILNDENIYARVQDNENFMIELMREVADETGKLKNVRGIGMMVAADLQVENPKVRAGYAVYQEAVRLGALLRPLGNTIYWLPPLNTNRDTLVELKDITVTAIKEGV